MHVSIKKLLVAAGFAGVLFAGAAPLANANDATPDVNHCTSSAETPAQGMAFAHASDSTVPQECSYKVSVGGDQGFVISSLNAWEVLVDGVVKASGANVLSDGGKAVTQGAVPATVGQVVTIRVIPGCEGDACGSSIQAAIGGR